MQGRNGRQDKEFPNDDEIDLDHCVPGVWTLPTSVRGLWRPPLCYCRVSAFRVALSALGRGVPVCPSRAANRVWTLPTTPWTLPTGRHRKINELPDISRGLCRTNK
jgi:hypothetical protein